MEVHEPDRAKKTIKVVVGSQDDATFVRENGVSMKPHNVCLPPSSLHKLTVDLVKGAG